MADEKIQNGGFDGGAAGWSNANGDRVETEPGAVYGVQSGGDGDNTVMEVDAAGSGDGYGPDSVYQNIATDDGKTYTFSFDAASRDVGSPQTNTIIVSWNGQVIDTIVPTSTDFQHYSYTVTANGGTGTVAFSEDPTQNDGLGGIVDNVSVQEVACFCPGTMISTPTGAKAVETLQIGDEIITAALETTRIKWIGRQRLNPVFAALHSQLPIRIAAGALGNKLPARDLIVSPDHAMLVEGCLVHAGALVNGRTIEIIKSCVGDIQYFHIETDLHEIILAEGAATETFMDNDARQRFDNAAEFAELYPDAEPMMELDLPRICFQRQLPRAITRVLDAIADELLGKVAIAA